MKRFTKDELQKQADALLKAYDAEFVTATVDGNFFLPDQSSQSLANDHHLKHVKTKFADAEVFKFEAPKKEGEAEKPVEPTHADKIAAVKSAIAEMQAFKITNPEALKAGLLKANFEPAIVAEVLNEMSTHS